MVRIIACIVATLVLSMGNHCAEAFLAPAPRQLMTNSGKADSSSSSSSASQSQAVSQSTVVLSMGLFDFFSEDAKKEREAKREAEIEEQERLQKEILKRRANPEAMEEYSARVAIRRRAIARGEDGSKYKVMLEDNDE
jgi:hypothetical protein